MKACRIGILLLLCISVSMADEAKDKQIAAAKLIRRAADQSTPSSPIQVKGTVRVHANGAVTEGAYEFTRLSPEQQQEVIAVRDQRQVRVAQGGKLSVQRTFTFPSVPMYMLSQTFSPRLVPSLLPEMSIGTVSKKSLDGTPVSCVEAGPEQRYAVGMCFSDQSGALVERTSGQYLKWRYSDFQPFGKKMLPRTIQAYLNEQLVAELKITDVMAPPANTTISTPEKAATFGWCEDQTVNFVEERRTPQYPAAARHSEIQGLVGVHAIVGSDGKLRDTNLVQKIQFLDQATLDAMPSWRYRPASCGGKAIESDTLIFVNFFLTH